MTLSLDLIIGVYGFQVTSLLDAVIAGDNYLGQIYANSYQLN